MAKFFSICFHPFQKLNALKILKGNPIAKDKIFFNENGFFVKCLFIIWSYQQLTLFTLLILQNDTPFINKQSNPLSPQQNFLGFQHNSIIFSNQLPRLDCSRNPGSFK
jgi:hypothetical protein